MTNLFDYFHFNLLSSMLAAPRTCHSTLLLVSGAADSKPLPQELISSFGKWLG